MLLRSHCFLERMLPCAQPRNESNNLNVMFADDDNDITRKFKL